MEVRYNTYLAGSPSKDGNIKSASISNYHDIESTADILARKAANRSAKSIDEKRFLYEVKHIK